MKRFLAIVSALFLVSTASKAASEHRLAVPSPDFWYAVPGGAPPTGATAAVQGIVVPSSVHPTVQTTPAGSVISWQRPDGTRQSFVVQGMSSFTFEPGPLAGTTYVPFRAVRAFPSLAGECCSCASWENSSESVEALSCVAGCLGCGCEGCICSPTYPCPTSPDGSMTLVAHNDPRTTITFDRTGANPGIVVGRHGRAAARFRGRQLAATVTATGETTIANPDSITLTGPVESRTSASGDGSRFAWRSPDASVVLRQPRSMPAPSLVGGTIDLIPQPDLLGPVLKRPALEPLKDRCSACGTHPNSEADLNIFDCVPGHSVCYRCVSWEC